MEFNLFCAERSWQSIKIITWKTDIHFVGYLWKEVYPSLNDTIFIGHVHFYYECFYSFFHTQKMISEHRDKIIILHFALFQSGVTGGFKYIVIS